MVTDFDMKYVREIYTKRTYKACVSLVILIITLISNTSHAQTFAPIGAKWHYGVIDWDGDFYITYESVKDTSIANRDCHIIQCTKYRFTSKPENHGRYIVSSDSLGNAYVYRKGKFLLLYKFNVKKGDVWYTHSPDTVFNSNKKDSCRIKVGRIDSVQCTGGKYIKKIETDSIQGNFTIRWYYKNIGGGRDLFPWVLPSDGWDEYFRCYHDSTTSLEIKQCDYNHAGIEDQEVPEPKLVLYPNPAVDVIHISGLPALQEAHSELVIYNTLGQIMYSNTGSGIKTGIDIDVSHFANGIYLCSLRSNKYKPIIQTFVINR